MAFPSFKGINKKYTKQSVPVQQTKCTATGTGRCDVQFALIED